MKTDIKFQIDQLRKDKIIYGVEAIAVNLACILIIIFVSTQSRLAPAMILAITRWVIIGGVAYTIYMGVTNYFRLRKIRQLEGQL